MHDRSHDQTQSPARAPAAPAHVPQPPAHPLLQLQRTYGNRLVQAMLAQRSMGAEGGDVAPELAERIDRARGGGAGLDSGVRGTMEGALGTDFGGVRVHTGGEAHDLNQALGARAFTTGSDVFFANGEYAPGSSDGRELIAHELTHVVQQGGGAGGGGPQASLEVGPADDAYEQEADAVARAVAQGEPASSSGRLDRSFLQRQETSNPPEMEEALKQQGAVQAKRLSAGRVSRSVIQRRGGAAVGTLSVASNVVSAGLTAGHAWLIWSPTGGALTTYGTWGNVAPIGLHRDRELTYAPAATRSTACDATDYAALTTFAAANNSWGYTNNCASFAARGWMTVTGEGVSYTTAFIPNPSALGAGIVALNGGTAGVLAPAAAGGSSSGPTSSTGSPSGASSSAGSSL